MLFDIFVHGDLCSNAPKNDGDHLRLVEPSALNVHSSYYLSVVY